MQFPKYLIRKNKKRIGYFDVLNGCSGDMIVGALIDAGLDFKKLKKELKKLPIKEYEIEVKKVKRKTDWNHYIEGTRFIVKPYEKWDNGASYKKIREIIENSFFDEGTVGKIVKIFDILAEAEMFVHREKKENVHFHKIGQIDAIIEIVSAIVGLELLEIEKVFASPIGISDLAPATCEILKEVPLVFKNIPFEITTPTGAAILKGVADFSSFNSNFYLEGVGYGAGSKEEPSPNMTKFLIGKIKNENEELVVIETNIDDMNPVLFTNLFDKLFKEGSLDVSLFQGIGKKGRPVFKIEIIAPENKIKEIGKILFQETSTIGFRFRKINRVILEREIKEVSTEFGKIKVKISYMNGEIVNVSPEYEDCKRISEEKNIPLKKVYSLLLKKLEIF
jgi:uncharacterized protein (TIGR00299 family) protein